MGVRVCVFGPIHRSSQEDDGLPLRHVSHLSFKFETAAPVAPALHRISTVTV